jgi:hypothetical protein
MEVKLDNGKHSKDPNSKSPNAQNLTKNIHAMKEMLLTKNSRLKNPKSTNRGNPPSNIILNQGGNPCFNQITIYTTNNTSNPKPNEINLRQYIFNKMNKPKSMSNIVSGSSQVRSASSNGH